MKRLLKQRPADRRKAAPGEVKVFDRQATDLPRGAEVVPMLMPDPYGGNWITVSRSIRDDPLARLHSRRQIDDAQYAAGRHWQEAYRVAGIGGISAVDPTRERVDGGRIPEPFTDRQRRAIAELAVVGRAVGQIGESVLRDVLAHGMTMEQIAAARGQRNRASIEFYGRLFRAALDAAAAVLGYAARNEQKWP